MNRQFQVDKIHKAGVFMSEVHNMVHRGILFSISHLFAGVIDTGSAEFLLVLTEGLHVRLSTSTTGQARGFFFDSPTVSSAGTAVTPRNRNGFSSNTLSGVTITHTPTTSDPGTQIVASVIPGGSKTRAVGASEEGFSEWILAPGTYLLRVTNTAGTAIDISLELEAYQPQSR